MNGTETMLLDIFWRIHEGRIHNTFESLHFLHHIFRNAVVFLDEAISNSAKLLVQRIVVLPQLLKLWLVFNRETYLVSGGFLKLAQFRLASLHFLLQLFDPLPQFLILFTQTFFHRFEQTGWVLCPKDSNAVWGYRVHRDMG